MLPMGISITLDYLNMQIRRICIFVLAQMEKSYKEKSILTDVNALTLTGDTIIPTIEGMACIFLKVLYMSKHMV